MNAGCKNAPYEASRRRLNWAWASIYETLFVSFRISSKTSIHGSCGLWIGGGAVVCAGLESLICVALVSTLSFTDEDR